MRNASSTSDSQYSTGLDDRGVGILTGHKSLCEYEKNLMRYTVIEAPLMSCFRKLSRDLYTGTNLGRYLHTGDVQKYKSDVTEQQGVPVDEE